MKQLTALLLGVLLLGGCGNGEAPIPSTSQALETTAFGQPVRIEVVAASPTQAEAALQEAMDDLLYIAEVSHPWRPGALARTNQLLAMTGEFSANPSGLPMIHQATVLYRQSDGHFNPAMGHLQGLWGFHQEKLDLALPAEPKALAELLASSPSMEDIHLEGIRMSSRNPNVRLDYGPYAAGHALDTARLRLREAGIRQARLQSGNAVVLLGEAEQPLSLPHYPDLALRLQADEAIYTVSIRDHYYEMDGRLIHAHISPFDGQPVRGIANLSVIHPSAAVAAAQAQALLIAGEEKIPVLADRMDITLYLLQREDGRRYATSALRERLGNPAAVDLLTAGR